MKSSEFTFVGRKPNYSPNENMGLRQNRSEMVWSSRQSIVVNPLTDVNVTSTTKKQNIERNFNDPQRMANIEEENGFWNDNFNESQQIPQYFETDTFNQQNFNQHLEQMDHGEPVEFEYNRENIENLMTEYQNMNDLVKLFTAENHTMRELLGGMEQSFDFISQNYSDPNSVRNEAIHSLKEIDSFTKNEGVVSLIQSFSAIDEDPKRSTMQYESQIDNVS